jgi:hypothetical protein
LTAREALTTASVTAEKVVEARMLVEVVAAKMAKEATTMKVAADEAVAAKPTEEATTKMTMDEAEAKTVADEATMKTVVNEAAVEMADQGATGVRATAESAGSGSSPAPVAGTKRAGVSGGSTPPSNSVVTFFSINLHCI